MAVVNYIIDKGLHKKLPKANVETYKNILPFFYPFDRNWSADVTRDNFNTGAFKAHAAYGEIIRNLLSSATELQSMLDKAEAQSEEQDESEEKSDNAEEGQEMPIFKEQEQILDAEHQRTPAAPLAELSEHLSAKDVSASQILVGTKRSRPQKTPSVNGLAKTVRCCKIREVEFLYEDFTKKRHEALVAESKWRGARDQLTCIKSPRTVTEMDN